MSSRHHMQIVAQLRGFDVLGIPHQEDDDDRRRHHRLQ